MFPKEIINVFVEQIRVDLSQGVSVGILQLYKDVRMSQQFHFLPQFFRSPRCLWLPIASGDFEDTRFIQLCCQRLHVLLVPAHEMNQAHILPLTRLHLPEHHFQGSRRGSHLSSRRSWACSKSDFQLLCLRLVHGRWQRWGCCLGLQLVPHLHGYGRLPNNPPAPPLVPHRSLHATGSGCWRSSLLLQHCHPTLQTGSVLFTPKLHNVPCSLGWISFLSMRPWKSGSNAFRASSSPRRCPGQTPPPLLRSVRSRRSSPQLFDPKWLRHST